MLVFVIDDNPDDRALVLHQLKAELPQATVREIGDAEQLEDAFANERPSLVITDLALGWTTGLDVLARVKALDPGCPVIMFTGAGDEQVAVEAMKAGLDDYVVKSPKRLVRLRASIRDAVANPAQKVSVSQRDAQTSEVAVKGQSAQDRCAQVAGELSSVIDLLRNRAEQQADPKIADQFSEIADRLASATGLLAHR